MSKSLFISTVSAKQMAREAEISAGIVRELRQLLEAERARSDRLESKLAATVARAKTRDRRQRRRLARSQAELEKAHAMYDNVSRSLSRVVCENTTLKYGQTGKSQAELEREVHSLKAALDEERWEHDRTLEMLKEEREKTEAEKYRSDRIWDDYNQTYDAWQTMRNECETLTARCEEREAEIADLRATRSEQQAEVTFGVQDTWGYRVRDSATAQLNRPDAEIAPFLPYEEVVKHLRALGYDENFLSCTALDLEWKAMLAQKLAFHTRLLRGFPTPDEAIQESMYICGATDKQLRELMQQLPAGELLPIPWSPGMNPEDEDPVIQRDKELNSIRQNTPIVMTLSEDLMREFLLRWRAHHKRLPGGLRVSDLD